ncbi:hypothetical protein ASPWEDRAFT_171629 [Aspergillus wentii DTO 134E9]|uniref:CENP-S associating centromere protein X-domain-containing protein n=1 Tax=Aspergillus wentii DTO 134E9 TaxID=1073089 RepID=A0A1L9RIP1_ASPWE|nr:uncharacterized protein ASPWEDRAFT_171629 [Aspergillus wentii DTO 134E9]KAI9932245.1 hypothetical protein MW887_009755 [Aspergillus wentii]OJJ34796.1 hypothetical protein ASPWEDRAFT_171629 [Aspergillus wentii DTO 134E9]
MPAERQPAQKRRVLPFKPPRQRDSASAGPSSAAAPAAPAASKANGKGKKATNSTETSSSKTTTRKPKTARKSAPQKPRANSPPSGSEHGSESEGSGSGSRERSRSRSFSGEPDYILAEITHNNQSEDVTSSEPAIPPKLLTKLLHHNFQNEKTKVAKDANGVVAKYIDVFVREALARAAYEKAEGGGGADAIGDGFLEVEDLEKMAPQLVLDF